MSNDHIKVTCVGYDSITLKEVMRITREGIYVADGVSVDEAAQAVLDALSAEIQRLVNVARADDAEEIERLREKLATVTAERDELEAALRVLVDRIEYYSSIGEEGRTTIEQWEYTEGSSDMSKAREALAKVGADKTGEV